MKDRRTAMRRFLEVDVRSTTVLDLGDLREPLIVNQWSSLESYDVPARLPIPRTALARFREARSARTWPCLVVDRSSESTWYSPELGLLMHDHPGKIHRELVYAGPSGG